MQPGRPKPLPAVGLSLRLPYAPTEVHLHASASFAVIAPLRYVTINGLPGSATLSASSASVRRSGALPSAALEDLTLRDHVGSVASTVSTIEPIATDATLVAQRDVSPAADTPRQARPQSEAATPALPPAHAHPLLVVEPLLELPATQTDAFVRLDCPLDALPPNSFVQISALPAAVTLSDGYRTETGSWIIAPSALQNLKIQAPVGFAGSARLVILLLDGQRNVLAERAVALYAASPVPAPPQHQVTAQPPLHEEISTSTLPTAAGSAAVKSGQGIPTPQQLAQAHRLLEQGEHFFEQGDVTIARQYFARAVRLGLPLAALKMAETHDPSELARHHVVGVQPDSSNARQWYERALRLGVRDAEARLRRLEGR